MKDGLSDKAMLAPGVRLCPPAKRDDAGRGPGQRTKKQTAAGNGGLFSAAQGGCGKSLGSGPAAKLGVNRGRVSAAERLVRAPGADMYMDAPASVQGGEGAIEVGSERSVSFPAGCGRMPALCIS